MDFFLKNKSCQTNDIYSSKVDKQLIQFIHKYLLSQAPRAQNSPR